MHMMPCEAYRKPQITAFLEKGACCKHNKYRLYSEKAREIVKTLEICSTNIPVVNHHNAYGALLLLY
jgi:hypothetical protein